MEHLNDAKGLYQVLIFALAVLMTHWIDKRIAILERRVRIGTLKK